MPNPFPGMNPYYEDPQGWKGVHNLLIGNIVRELGDMLPPPFYVGVEDRVYIGTPQDYYYPDVTVKRLPRTTRSGAKPRATASTIAVAVADTDVVADTPLVFKLRREEISEPFVAVRSLRDNRALVLAIELLSPTNKQRGNEGRTSYQTKQSEMLRSPAHFLEIDLLRGGAHTVAVPERDVREQVGRWDYITCLHRAGTASEQLRTGNAGRYECWPTALRERLPRVLVPLTSGFNDLVLDVQAVLNQATDIKAYERGINYAAEPDPFLRPDDAEWADAVLREQGLRS